MRALKPNAFLVFTRVVLSSIPVVSPLHLRPLWRLLVLLRSWVQRPINRFADRSIDRPIGRWAGSSVGQSVGRSVGRSTHRSARSVGPSIGRSVGRPAGRPVGRSIARSHRSVARSIGRLVLPCGLLHRRLPLALLPPLLRRRLRPAPPPLGRPRLVLGPPHRHPLLPFHLRVNHLRPWTPGAGQHQLPVCRPHHQHPHHRGLHALPAPVPLLFLYNHLQMHNEAINSKCQWGPQQFGTSYM